MALEELYEPTADELETPLLPPDEQHSQEMSAASKEERKPLERPETVPETSEPEPERKQPEPTGEDPESAYARTKGWLPKEEWKGNPNAWKPAKEWLEGGESIQQLRHQISALQGNYVRFVREQNARTQAAIADARKTWETELRTARREFDWDRVEQAEGKIRELDQAATTEPPGIAGPVRDTNYFSSVWLPQNSWYDEQKNPQVYAQATAFGEFLEAKGVPYHQMLEQVRAAYGPKDTPQFRPSTPGNSPVEAPRNGGPRREVSSRWNDLKEDARKDFNFLVRNGVYQNNDRDRAAYAREVLEG